MAFQRAGWSPAPATPARTASRSSCPPRAAKTGLEALLDAGVKPCGLGARDTLRLEAGMNLYGQDMDEGDHALRSRPALDGGSEGRRARLHRKVGAGAGRRRQAANQFQGLLLLDRGVLRAHQKVITRWARVKPPAAVSRPRSNQSIALARLPHGIAVGSEVDVEIRDKRLKARVVKPFRPQRQTFDLTPMASQSVLESWLADSIEPPGLGKLGPPPFPPHGGFLNGSLRSTYAPPQSIVSR
jgi:hypothetical protein